MWALKNEVAIMFNHLFHRFANICKVSAIFLGLFSALYFTTTFFAYESLAHFQVVTTQFLDVQNFA